MLSLALVALLQVAPPAPRDTAAPSATVVGASIGSERRLPLDSIAPRRAGDYATPALAALVGEASVRNRRVPPALEGYTARVESEMALVLKRPEGQEITASLEQTSNLVRWKRTGEYEQRVVGYRATQLSIAPSIVGVSESAWTVPTLYGNRILLLSGIDSARRSKRDSVRRERAARDPKGAARAARNRVYLAEHPLGEERDRFYRFTGGDTVARIVVHGHTVDVVRVTVEPRGGYTRRVVVFRGEMDLDARRRQLVRLRGYFDEVGPPLPNTPGRLLSRTMQAVAYVELVNQEVNGAWWLPTYQRIEPQVAMPALGDGRSVMRIVSRWRDLQVQQGPEAQAWAAALARGDTTVPDPAMDSAAAHDTLRAQKHRLSFAPRDSIDGFAAWAAELGAESAKVRAEDFDDIAPDRWRPTGRPRFEWRVSRPSDVARFNRVEGLFTGYGAELRMRDAAPGVTVRATAGWAWHEQAARGRLVVDRTRRRTSVGIRGGRWVDLTNDFRSAMDSGSSLAAVLGTDAYDYVDRTGAAAYATRRLTRDAAEGGRPLVARIEAGVMHDGAMRRVVREAPIPMGTSDSGFLENRGVREGTYARVVTQLELDPDMSGEGLRPGVGALLHLEVASGDLNYARTEARVLGRRSWGSRSGTTTLALRGDAGAVYYMGADGLVFGADGSHVPPQQLFELGGEGGALPGYEYKEFAGDRAMLARVLAMHTFPLLKRPMRVTRSFALPGLQPGVSVGWQSGWASVGDRAARYVLTALVPPGSAPGTTVSRPTDGVRSSLDLRLRFFGGNASLGFARPVERGGKWRFVAGLVQEL